MPAILPCSPQQCLRRVLNHLESPYSALLDRMRCAHLSIDQAACTLSGRLEPTYQVAKAVADWWPTLSLWQTFVGCCWLWTAVVDLSVVNVVAREPS